MSKNIDQVFIANPITSNASTDLMYFGQSPYGVGNDAAMTYANFSAQFGAPYTAAALTKTDDTNVTLTLGGTPSTALLHAASLTLGWTGQLGLTRGGSNASLTASNGGIVYSSATAMAILSGTATSGLPLLSGSSAAPTWGSFALSLGGALTTAGALTTVGAFGVTFTFTNTTSVTFPTSGTLATTAQIPTGAALTKTDDTNVTLTLGGSPTTALVNAASITAGWTGTLSGTRGGTGVNNGASTITIGGNVTFSGGFTFAGTITGNTAVTFPTSGTLATTAQAITNVNQTSSSATLAANSRYATNNGASLVTYTIPAGAAVGDTYIIVGGSSGGWTVAQPASVQCHLGNSATTSGVGGSLASSNQYDSATITCVASNVFTVYGVQGNITIV
jgi:hypothetical protein